MSKFEYTQAFGPDSTAIDRVAFNEGTEELFVRFTNGNERVYYDVSLDTFVEFGGAESAGRFYNHNISGKYSSFAPQEVTQLVMINPDGDFKFRLESSGEGFFSSYAPDDSDTTLTLSVPSNYTVTWHLEGTSIGGMPQYTAVSEDDAIQQFFKAVAQFVSPESASKVRVKAVTHYLD